MVTYVQYMLSMVDEVTNYFFDKTNSLYWTRDGLQWNLHGSIPPMTDIGASIINAIVTIMYSQIIEMAKLSIIFSGEQLSLVECMAWDHEVVGSNPTSPTMLEQL